MSHQDVVRKLEQRFTENAQEIHVRIQLQQRGRVLECFITHGDFVAFTKKRKATVIPVQVKRKRGRGGQRQTERLQVTKMRSMVISV